MPTQSHSNKTGRKLPIFGDSYQLAKFLEENFTESLKQMIRLIVKTMVKEEMEEYRNTIDEKLYFNGTYGRNMISSFGRVEDIPIPRFRTNNNLQPLKTMNVFDEERGKFEKLVSEMHLLGISQRKIKYLSQVCFGIPISKDRVGMIYKELADREEFQINTKPISDEYEYVLLDGMWEKTKGYGWEENKSVILCALGIKATGERRILGFTIARHEDIPGWERLVKNLKSRGLMGKQLKLIITDDNQALRTVAAMIYPNVLQQTCVVHKMRSVFAKTSYRNRVLIMEDLKTIFAVQTRGEAILKTKAVVKKWYIVEPKAMESLRFHIEDCFTYFSFPKEIWSKVRTTNVLEREFRELRRRMKVFDNTFQSEESANRYTNTIISYLNQNYPLKNKLHTNT